MLNKVMIIGRLGRDPELSYGKTGSPYSRVSVGTNESYVDRDGNKVNVAQWHNVMVFGKTAESLCKYTAKGATLYVEGKLKTDSWEDPKSGQKVYKTYIVAERVQFLSSKQQESGQYQQQYTQPQPMNYQPQHTQPQAQQTQQVQELPQERQTQLEYIPF